MFLKVLTIQPTKNSVAALNDLTENSNAKLSKAQQLRDLVGCTFN